MAIKSAGLAHARGLLWWFQVTLAVRTNLVTEIGPRARLHNVSLIYVSLTIGTTRRSRGVEWGINLRHKPLNRPFKACLEAVLGIFILGAHYVRPRVKVVIPLLLAFVVASLLLTFGFPKVRVVKYCQARTWGAHDAPVHAPAYTHEKCSQKMRDSPAPGFGYFAKMPNF